MLVKGLDEALGRGIASGALGLVGLLPYLFFLVCWFSSFLLGGCKKKVFVATIPRVEMLGQTRSRTLKVGAERLRQAFF